MDGDANDEEFNWDKIADDILDTIDSIDTSAKTELDPVNLVVFEKEESESERILGIVPYLTDKTASIMIPKTYYNMPFTSHDVVVHVNHN